MLNKKFFLYFLLSFWHFLLVYLNLSQRIFAGDAAEYATTNVTWGIPHPPGYPFYSLLANIINYLLPIKNIYVKSSLLSAIPITLSSFILLELFLKLKIHYFISFLSVMFFITLFPVWLYSIFPEVFSLASFLIFAQIFLLISIKEKQHKGFLYLFFLTIGLSFSHHHFFVFFLLSYLYLILTSKKLKIFFKKNFFTSLNFFFMGLSFYLYPIIVSYLNKTVSIEDVKSVSGFMSLFFRSVYGTFKAYAYAPSIFSNRIFDFFAVYIFVLHDFKPAGFIFIILGIMYLLIQQKQLFRFFTIQLFLVNFFFFYANYFLRNNFSAATFERFLIFFYLILIIFFTYGVYFSFKILKKIIKKLTNKVILLKVSYFVLYLIMLFLIFFNIRVYLPLIKYVKTQNLFENYGRDLLINLPKKSILFAISDNSSFLTKHYQTIFHLRKDILVLTPFYLERNHLRNYIKEKYPDVFLPNINKSDWLREFLRKNSQNYQIFSIEPYNIDYWSPYGLVWRYYSDKKKEKQDEKDLILINKKLWQSYQIPKIETKYKNILFVDNLQDVYVRSFSYFIDYLLKLSKDDEAKTFLDNYFSYFKNNKNYLEKYLTINLKNKNCSSNTKNAVFYLKKNLFNFNDNIYLLFGVYYDYCENDQKIANKYYERYLKLIKTKNKID